MSATPYLALSGLRWRHHGRQILDDVGLQLPAGGLVGLLGPNGCGKTSVLSALLGLVRVNAGTLQIEGVPTALGARTLRRQLGVAFQARSLDGKLSVVENLRLGAALYGWRGAPLTRAVAQALVAVELTERGHERAARLSGGLWRRVELARAQLHEPRALVLDEPTQGLDVGARQVFWQRLAALRARGTAALISTHDPQEAARCAELVVMQAGRVVASGTPADLLAKVAHDVIVLEGDEPDQLLAQVAALKLGDQAPFLDGQLVQLPCTAGHRLVPRLVEALGEGRLRAMHLRRASLADAFMQLTGHSFAGRHRDNRHADR